MNSSIKNLYAKCTLWRMKRAATSRRITHMGVFESYKCKGLPTKNIPVFITEYIPMLDTWYIYGSCMYEEDGKLGIHTFANEIAKGVVMNDIKVLPEKGLLQVTVIRNDNTCVSYIHDVFRPGIKTDLKIISPATEVSPNRWH